MTITVIVLMEVMNLGLRLVGIVISGVRMKDMKGLGY
jgi:hypothetical protein